MDKSSKCPICSMLFNDCPHSVTEADSRLDLNKKLKKISKRLKDLDDDAPITKKLLLAVIRDL